MVHAVAARSPPHVDPTSTFYGILFSTLNFSYKAWIFKIHSSLINRSLNPLLKELFSSLLFFIFLLSSLISWVTYLILLVFAILGIYPRCSCCILGDLRIYCG